MLKGILLQYFLAFLWVAAFSGMAVGLGMLVKHEQLMRLNRYFSRWTSTDKFSEQLDRPRWTERFFYRHHRLIGASLFIGAAVILYTFLFSYNLRRVSPFIATEYWWLLDALMAMLLIGSVPAAIVGFIMLTKPSLIRELECSANRWISTERFQNWVNETNYSVEQSIMQHRKLTGVCLILGSMYILGILSRFFSFGTGKF